MMAHLSPPPSPPITSSKLLNYPNIMNGLDKLYASMTPSSILQRANLNTALRQNLNRGMLKTQFTYLISIWSDSPPTSAPPPPQSRSNMTPSRDRIQYYYTYTYTQMKKRKETPPNNFYATHS